MTPDMKGDARLPSPAESVLPDPPPIHPSFIQLAKPYIFEQTIQRCIAAMGVNPLREEALRLQGVTWIDNVRRVLYLYVELDAILLTSADTPSPIRTFDTAVVYYHKFRLVHPDNEYSYTVSLPTACCQEFITDGSCLGRCRGCSLHRVQD